MATLLLRLVGPMQSWGTTSRFDERDTGPEPSKSGVLGLVAAAMGVERGDWVALEPLSHLGMGVRHDRPGVPAKDYQTAGCAQGDSIIKADGSQAKGGGVVSSRHYLADAAFLVGLEGQDRGLLERIHEALQRPRWPLALGRKGYLPSEAPWLPAAWNPIQDGALLAVLLAQPWIATLRPGEKAPERLRLSLESKDGSGVMRMDQLLSSFEDRRFGARYIRSEWVPFPGEACHVPA
nr:type I-E CRISPR-associated protein Cas5/CasD [uncultured Holophaga sp.]